MKNGKMNGNGKFSWSDKSSYHGEWKDDKFHGKGTMTFSNGDKFEGQYHIL